MPCASCISGSVKTVVQGRQESQWITGKGSDILKVDSESQEADEEELVLSRVL